MYLVGLTGGIGSGKSTVSNILRELGCPVLDADEIAREIVEPGKPAYFDIVKEFGPQVLFEDGRLDRKELARMVFGHPERLARLNDITHPRVKERLEEKTRELAHEEIVVWDVPLLFEAEMHHLVDEVWLVWVDKNTQVERVINRDACSVNEALSRISSQMDLDEKKEKADRIIDNRGTIVETKNAVTRYYNQLSSILKSRSI